LVVLQRLEEERRMDLPPVNCRCTKARNINEELKSVGRSLSSMSKLGERLGNDANNGSHHQMNTLSLDIVRLADMLRADVSILIPSSMGGAEPSVAAHARSIVNETECEESLVAETVEAVSKLVFSLLGVDTCRHCNAHGDSSQPSEQMEDQEIDPDIMNMVAAMCGDYSKSSSDIDKQEKSNQEIGRQVLERSRKRKQNRPTKFQLNNAPLPQSWKNTAPNSVTGSPTKKVRKIGDLDNGSRPTEILFLLEKKKKLVKKDGLYKFVLWREALREEKNKACLT